MPVRVALLRGVNVGGAGRLPMAGLRSLFEQLGCHGVSTLIQSGNVIFDGPSLTEHDLEVAIERTFGFRPAVILRTPVELRAVVERNPFTGRDPAKVLVTFLQVDPGEPARQAARALSTGPEELIVTGREMYCFYPEGQGRSRFPVQKIERALGCPGTARNWNTVLRLLLLTEPARSSATPSES